MCGILRYEPQHEISNNVVCVTNKGLDQPAHTGSLIRAFASRLNILRLLTDQHLEFLSLKGGCTGLSESKLVKIPHCWKSHVEAHLVLYILFNYLAIISLRNRELVALLKLYSFLFVYVFVCMCSTASSSWCHGFVCDR